MPRWFLARLGPAVFAPLLVVAIFTGSLCAQERNIRFRQLSIEDGLSQSTVKCILQDRHGFIWIGTEDGLNRFDGYTFTIYKHDLDDPASLSDSWVWTLFEDSEGILWAGTRAGGLNRFHPETESFTRFQNTPEDPTSLSNDSVRVIYEDTQRNLWIGTAGGLNRFDRATSGFARFHHNPSKPDSLAHDLVLAIYEDRNGTLWVGTEDGGVDELNRLEGSFRHHGHDSEDPTTISADRIDEILEDGDGLLWVASYGGGLSRLHTVTGQFERFQHDPANPNSLAHNRVLDVIKDRDGTLWVSTEDGLNEYLPETGSFARYGHDPVDPRSLSGNAVTAVFQDRGGVLWVGTKASGVNTWNVVTGSFSHFKHEPDDPTSLSSNIVTAFADAGDDLWIGTFRGGLNRLHRPSSTFEQFLHDPSDPNSLNDNRVGSLLLDSSGALWVGTFGDGLNRLNLATGHIERYVHDPENPSSLSAGGVPAIFEDSEGVVWVGTHGGGLNRFVPGTGTFVHYTHDPERPTSLGSNRVMTFAEDSSGVLWIGTAGGGLNRFDRANGTFSRYQHNDDDPESLASDDVMSIFEDGAGALWLGTAGGLNRWDRVLRNAHRGLFKRYTERDGLPNNFVYGILPDDDGNLWLSTNRGLSKFNAAKGTFKNFDVTQGLQSNEFNTGAYHASVSGEMFFGGVNGFNAFYPKDVRGNTHAPQVALTGFFKFNQPVELDHALTDLDRVELDYRDYVVSFEFAALDFTAPEKNTYAYKLEGFDRDWMHLGNNRRVTYTNLEAGDYTFRVKGSNNDGVEGKEGVEIQMHVVPSPWKTWWAYGLYSMFVCGLLFAYARAQQRKLEREAEYSRKLEREVEARTRELAAGKEDLEKLNVKLEEASLTDTLTGLKNRRYVATHVRREMDELLKNYELYRNNERQPAHDKVLLMIDLDGYKGINDTYGHTAGDEVLVKIREVLTGACRESDTLVRWGGDEFMVTGRTTGARAIEFLAERIRSAVEACHFDFGGDEEARLSCSIGFACFPFASAAPHLLTWEQVLTIADRALYASKNTGRNAWVGILSSKKIASDGKEFLAAIEDDPEKLIADETIEIVTSVSRPLEWGKEVESLRA